MEEIKRINWVVRQASTVVLNQQEILNLPLTQKIFFGANSNFELLGSEINIDTDTPEQVKVISYSLINLDGTGNAVTPAGAAYFDNGTGQSQGGDFDIATFQKEYCTLPGPMAIAQGLGIINLKIEPSKTLGIGTNFRISIALTLRGKG